MQERAATAFPHAETGIEAFQPTLNFARTYTPDIFNGFGKLGQIAGYYDGNGHYARAQLGLQHLQAATTKTANSNRSRRANSSTPSAARPRSQAAVPGGATQPASDGSNPFTDPPFAGSGVSSSECSPGDSP